MKAKQVKHYLPLDIGIIQKGRSAVVYVWYEPKDYQIAIHPPGLMPYRLQKTSTITRVLKNGIFYTLNSKFIPRRLN